VLCKQGVAGSIPATSTRIPIKHWLSGVFGEQVCLRRLLGLPLVYLGRRVYSLPLSLCLAGCVGSFGECAVVLASAFRCITFLALRRAVDAIPFTRFKRKLGVAHAAASNGSWFITLPLQLGECSARWRAVALIDAHALESLLALVASAVPSPLRNAPAFSGVAATGAAKLAARSECPVAARADFWWMIGVRFVLADKGLARVAASLRPPQHVDRVRPLADGTGARRAGRNRWPKLSGQQRIVGKKVHHRGGKGELSGGVVLLPMKIGTRNSRCAKRKAVL